MLVIYRVITIIFCDLYLISISCLHLLMRLILEALILRQAIIHRLVATTMMVSDYLLFLLWAHACAVNLVVASHRCCFVFCCSHHDNVAHRVVLLTTTADQIYHLL